MTEVYVFLRETSEKFSLYAEFLQPSSKYQGVLISRMVVLAQAAVSVEAILYAELLQPSSKYQGVLISRMVVLAQAAVSVEAIQQVSTPEIKVLNWTLENGNCSLMLACMVEKGDHVVYGWSTEAGTHLPSAANASHPLYLTLGPQHADENYTCTASNPISNRSQTFTPWSSCSSYSYSVPGQWGLYAGLALGGVIGVIMILQVAILLFRRRAGLRRFPNGLWQLHIQNTRIENMGFDSVQKKPNPLPAQDPCTTIYVAATEPVPEPAQEPSSITVYASVTLPES
ncbi:PREDICTED: signaling lymphocytic activation molecule [Myotis davidii]|uniref:signaling lymphocytic activation molecule n=1 Tax=Myotis davidii TaxID=225400 RepID=UPI0007676BCD|nr:PREDICTED: signaling lymphocytic activation molecule [Myotis davidii]